MCTYLMGPAVAGDSAQLLKLKMEGLTLPSVGLHYMDGYQKITSTVGDGDLCLNIYGLPILITETFAHV